MEVLKKYVFKDIIRKKDKELSDYKYISFDVPKQADIIHVSYNYSRAPTNNNVLDIGIFDSKASFRGWSGSNKSKFFISNDAATPGYLRGRIYPGTWKIILGLYRISREGCNYIVKIRIGKIRETLRERRAVRPSKAKMSKKRRWFKGDLHVHTNHSDGAKSIDELVSEAKKIGLDFLALTDHNTVSQNLHIAKYRPSEVLLIPAEEVTTYYGHANVWGNRGWINFRCRTMRDFQELIDEVHTQGLLFSVNHPKAVGYSDSHWKYKEINGFDCIEVWQGPWPLLNYQSLAWWDRLLQKGKRIVAVGGSDFHGKNSEISLIRLGNPTTWVYSNILSVSAILSSIGGGHVFISTYVDGPEIRLYADANDNGRLDCMCGDEIFLSRKDKLTIYVEAKGAKGLELRLISEGKAVKIDKVNAAHHVSTYRLRVEKDGYFRAEIARPSKQGGNDSVKTEMLALTNPIYVRVG